VARFAGLTLIVILAEERPRETVACLGMAARVGGPVPGQGHGATARRAYSPGSPQGAEALAAKRVW
jgi:hypothetical protein